MATFPSDSVRTKNWSTEILTDSDLESQLDLIHDYIKALLNSSTGHTHDGTSNQSVKLNSGAIGATFVSGLTTVTGVSTDHIMIADASDSNAPKKALASDFIYVPTATNALAGSVVQTKNVSYASMSTGTTAIPNDDTIPQNTEGDEYFTLAITPTSATNKLLIRAWAHVSNNSGSISETMALFQDSTAGSLNSAFMIWTATTQYMQPLFLEHYMDAGTTSETTFKIRIGGASGTTTINGTNGARKLGGVLISGMTIQEIKV